MGHVEPLVGSITGVGDILLFGLDLLGSGTRTVEDLFRTRGDGPRGLDQ